MTIRVDFHVLEVGQGMMNFVEVYDLAPDEPPSAAKLVTTFLFDAGSQAKDRFGPQASLDYVIGVLSGMAAAKQQAEIGALVLSHGDSDHVNMVVSILNRFTPPIATVGARLSINNIFFSGSRLEYKKRSVPILGHAEGFLKPSNRSKTWRYNATQVSPDPLEWTKMWPREEDQHLPDSVKSRLAIYLVAANCAVHMIGSEDYDPDLPSAAERNTASLVTLLEFNTDAGPRRFVINGDATAETMDWCINNLGRATRLEAFHATAPHHGAGATAANIRKRLREDDEEEEISMFEVHPPGFERVLDDIARQNLEEFAAVLSARSLSTSAGKGNSYSHPEMLALTPYAKYFRPEPYFGDPNLGDGRHLITVYCQQKVFARVRKQPDETYVVESETWPPVNGGGMFTVKAECNLFTTQYADATRSIEQKYVLTGFIEEKNTQGILEEPPETPLNAPEGINWIFIVNQDGTEEVCYREHRALVVPSTCRAPMPQVASAAELPPQHLVAPSRPRPRDAVALPPEPPRALKLIG